MAKHVGVLYDNKPVTHHLALFFLHLWRRTQIHKKFQLLLQGTDKILSLLDNGKILLWALWFLTPFSVLVNHNEQIWYWRVKIIHDLWFGFFLGNFCGSRKVEWVKKKKERSRKVSYFYFILSVVLFPKFWPIFIYCRIYQSHSVLWTTKKVKASGLKSLETEQEDTVTDLIIPWK